MNAAEITRLKAALRDAADQIANLESDLGAAQARVAELETATALVAEFCANRASYITSILNCHPDNAHDYHRWQGHAESRRQLSELLGLPVAWPAETKPAPVPHQRGESR